MSIQGATIGLQIMDEATGDWLDVGGLESVEFTEEPHDEAEVAIDGEQSWTLQGTVTGDTGGLWEAIERAEREAFAARCRARAWLMFPYRIERIHR
ncbi:hypothetical protein SEA_DELAGARZA_2 [Microbacterium phage DelaGarza]|nr:hypothetical protein SEA_DELAGARZA_2 [Microbacterium phage DelaGarza]